MDPHIASPSDVTEIAVSPAERVVPEVHRGDPREAQRPSRVWRSGARGVPVDPRGRAAIQVRTVASIAPEAVRRLDGSKVVKVEIDGLPPLAMAAPISSRDAIAGLQAAAAASSALGLMSPERRFSRSR